MIETCFKLFFFRKRKASTQLPYQSKQRTVRFIGDMRKEDFKSPECFDVIQNLKAKSDCRYNVCKQKLQA